MLVYQTQHRCIRNQIEKKTKAEYNLKYPVLPPKNLMVRPFLIHLYIYLHCHFSKCQFCIICLQEIKGMLIDEQSVQIYPVKFPKNEKLRESLRILKINNFRYMLREFKVEYLSMTVD